MIKYVAVLIMMFVTTQVQASDISCSIGDIEDSRATGQHSGRLNVEIKLAGKEIEGAEKFKASMTEAVDDTGRDLIEKGKGSDGNKFKGLDKDKAGRGEIEVELKNPARKATVIKQMSGEIELYCPGSDPSATVRVGQFMKNLGKPVDDPILKASKVEVTVYDKKTFEEISKGDAKMQKKLSGEEITNQLAGAMSKIFGATFELSSENSIIFKLKDPKSKLIEIQFYRASGQKIKSKIWSTDDVRIYYFDSPVPADATLSIMLKTDNSIRKIPFKFTDVPLP